MLRVHLLESTPCARLRNPCHAIADAHWGYCDLKLIVQVPSAAGARHRNRKKWWPQREHRNGHSIQCRAFSTPFRMPTSLNSIDLQYGQCGGDMVIIALTVCLRRTTGSASRAISETERSYVRAWSIRPAANRPTGLASGLNLFRRPQVRL
jgi:hypothetical protein